MDKKTINDSNLREALRLEYANIPQLPAGLNEKTMKRIENRWRSISHRKYNQGMGKVDEILERLKGMEVVISNPEELTERIMASITTSETQSVTI